MWQKPLQIVYQMNYPTIKRFLDIVLSAIGFIILSPVFILVAILISLESKGGPFYIQERVGKDRKPFGLYKFRSMYINSEKKGQLTIGKDTRITKVGKIVRSLKIDELPQLLNVLKGDMSLVGPRPEVPKYVEHYTDEQLKVLTVKPGITDLASIKYIKENELLGKSENPESTYLNEILPDKLELNLQYINQMSLINDIGIILKTIGRIFRK